MNSPCLFLQRLGVDDLRVERRLMMKEIASEVAERHELTLEDLRGPSRYRTVAWARQEAMALIRAEGRYSYPQIGRFFGGRDHTTILVGVRHHEARQAAREGMAA